jgi:hypothetical protein
VTFEEELESFWKAFSQAERECMESYPPYQDAVRARNSTKAQEIACSLFSGDDKAKAKALRDCGIAYLELAGGKVIPGRWRDTGGT